METIYKYNLENPQTTEYPILSDSNFIELGDWNDIIKNWTRNQLKEYLNYLIYYKKGLYKDLTYISIGEVSISCQYMWQD